MKFRWTSLVVPVVFVAILIAPRVHAAGLVVPCDTQTTTTVGANGVSHTVFTNPCTVDKFVEQFIKLSQYALTLVVVLALLMMVYGGFQFITAAGRPSKVEEGKKVIEGTIVGLMVTFTAFVIVNFVIASLTDSPAARRNINPFGAVAQVFLGRTIDSKNINRPFNSTGQTSDSGKCYSLSSGWDKDCSDQLHCADTSKDSGDVHNAQQKLTDLHCNPQGIDGCFGPKTLEAVRRFQIANNLPPTGQIDQKTNGALSASPKACDADQATTALVNGVSGQLPAAQDSTQSRETTGCCVIRDGGVGLFCANQVSQRTCAAQGGEFHAGALNCANDAATRDTCGYCADSRTHQCFEMTTDFWCTNVVRDPTDSTFRMTFQPGRTCGGESACDEPQNGCAQELLNLPP